MTLLLPSDGLRAADLGHGSVSVKATVYRPPTVTAVSPAFGPVAGGNLVEITGSGFRRGAIVTFGGRLATNVIVKSAIIITADVPAAGGLGAVDVVVRNRDGSFSVLASAYIYVGGAPAVIRINPFVGPPTGGTIATVTGSNFVPGTALLFGNVRATSVQVLDPTSLVVTSPPGARGFVDLTVRNPDGQSSTLLNGFAYAPPSGPAPVVSAVTPASGPNTSATNAIVAGTNFVAGDIVLVGGVPAAGVRILSGRTLSATFPAQPAVSGPVDVSVTDLQGQSSTRLRAFTYLASPIITAVNPVVGPTAGGTPVTIGGRFFVTGATVTIGGALATTVRVVNARTITAIAPLGLKGPADVVVIDPDGQSATLAGGFTYVSPTAAPPAIAAISPNAGVPGGGAVVSISGKNFQPGVDVLFGSAPASNVQVFSATSIVGTRPRGTLGFVDLTVVNSDGQSSTRFCAFAYANPFTPLRFSTP